MYHSDMKKSSQKNDKTSRERQARRRSLLDRIARAAGFSSWTKLETEILNGRARISKN